MDGEERRRGGSRNAWMADPINGSLAEPMSWNPACKPPGLGRCGGRLRGDRRRSVNCILEFLRDSIIARHSARLAELAEFAELHPQNVTTRPNSQERWKTEKPKSELGP